MKKILLILTTLLTITNGAWAQSVPTFTATDPESLADGWYQIKWITTNGASDYTDAEVEGKFVTNYPGDITVNNKKYSLFLGNAPATLDEHAKTFVYLEGRVSEGDYGSHGNLRSANGHYISITGESSTTKPAVNYIIYFSKSSYRYNSTITSSKVSGTSRISLEPQGKNATPYIGQTNSTEKFPMVQFSPVNLSNIGLQAWTVNFVVQTDITIEYTGSQNYGIDKVYNGGKFFFAQGVTPEASDFTINGTDPNYDANPVIIIDSENKIIKITQHANRDITVPDGHNGYVGYNTNISDSEWKTKEYWKLNDDWYSNGPGNKETSGSRGMWSPIYLKDITGGTVPALDGWKFRMIADNSTYTIASVGKIQNGDDVSSYITLKNGSDVTMNFGTGTANPFTVNLNEGTGNNLTFEMSSNFGSSITVNYGNVTTTTNRVFNASASSNKTITTLTLNATFTEPAEYNNVEEITLVTFSNVSASTITTTNLTPVGDGWTPVNSKAELETQTTAGKFYFIEKNSDGVKLYTYKTQIYNVAANTTETLRQIPNYESYLFFNVPENSTLIIDVDDFDLTKITFSGTGRITLNYFPTAETHPTFNDDWTGSIEFAEGGSNSTNLTALFNAWGNSYSTIMLNNVNGGYLITYDSNYPTTTAVNPTVNILADKTLILNNGNSNANARISKVTGAGTIDRQGWSGSTQHNLYITTLTGFTGTLNGSGYPIIVENLVLAEGPAVDDLLFKTSGTVTFTKPDSKLFIGNVDKTDGYAWEEKTVNSIKGYYIIPSAQQKIYDAFVFFYQYPVGTGVGEYTISLGEGRYTNYNDFENVVVNMQSLADWEGKTLSATINQPTTGYYKLKSKYNENTGYYLSCENNNDGKAIQTTTTDAKNIFYIEVGNSNSSINSYSTGFYFGNETYSNYTSATNDPIKWTFSEGQSIGTYKLTSTYSGSKILYGWSTDSKSYVDRNGVATDDGHTDWILIPVAKEDLPVIEAPGSTTTNPVILGNITSTDDVTGKIDASATFVDLSDATISASIDEIKAEVAKINPNAIIIAPEGTSVEGETSNVLVPTGNASEYTCNNLQLNDEVIAQFATDETNFTDTKVTYTRANSASVWGTICLPYATSTEGDISYYRLVESSTSNLSFEKISEANTTANEPYLIKKEAGAGLSVSAEGQNFCIGIAGSQNGSSHNDFKLQGVLVNTSVIDGTTYTIAKSGYDVATTDPNAYYFDAANNTFRKMNGRFNLKAFRAYLTATSANARENIGIDIFDNDQPTGISFVESEGGNTVDVIFDLNGRRLQNAKKGINIINGKKVVK